MAKLLSDAAFTTIETLPPLSSDAVLLSVVMPCFNAGPYLAEAIESILRQTYDTFEFVIYDDGSTDTSYETALRYAARDRRIRVIRGHSRGGPVVSSRAAAQAATTPFVARMDADDVARTDRLELQLRGLLNVPDASVIGSLYTFIDRSGALVRRSNRGQLLGRRPQLVHPSLMYRRDIMERVGGYRDDTELVEDTDLLSRLSAAGPMLIVPQPLIAMRMATQSFRSQGDLQDIEDWMSRAMPIHGRAGRRRIEPVIYHTIALTATFRGTRPHMLMRALRRMRMRPFGVALRALLLLTLATLSPRLARRCSSLWAAVSDLLASRTISPDSLFAWHDGVLTDRGTAFRTTPLP